MSEDAATKVRCSSPHSCSPRARRVWCKHAKEPRSSRVTRDLAPWRAVMPDASTSCILKTRRVTAYFRSVKTIVYSAKCTQSVHRTLSAIVCCRGDLCSDRYVFFREKIVVSTSKTILRTRNERAHSANGSPYIVTYLHIRKPKCPTHDPARPCT